MGHKDEWESQGKMGKWIRRDDVFIIRHHECRHFCDIQKGTLYTWGLELETVQAKDRNLDMISQSL